MTTATVGPNEVDLAPAEFDQIRALVRERSGIVLEDGKEYLVTNRLLPVLRRHELPNLAALCAQLRSSPGLAADVVDAMTTNETSFFRDVHPFEALRQQLIPELLSRPGRDGQLDIWSAASSSGQEPFSVAILLAEHFPDLVASRRARILATDLSPSMVERTRDAVYTRLEVNRGLSAAMLLRWFDKDGAGFRVKPALRELVDARQLNLLEARTVGRRFDVILCRNVLIYFDQETKARTIESLRSALTPGGYLILGATENLLGMQDGWVRTQHDRLVAYRLDSNAPHA